MHNRLVSALRQLGGDLDRYLEPNAIEDVCRRLGYTWRKRVLDPVTTIHLFILQVLAGNTAMTHLRHLAHLPVSDSALLPSTSAAAFACFRETTGPGRLFLEADHAKGRSTCGVATD